MKKLFGLLLALLAVVSCEEGVLFESTLKFAEGETLTFKGFETKRLTVVHTPEDADLGEGNIKWSTSNPMIAKARRGGFVEAIGIGECDIKAEAYVADQYVSAVCHVVVGEAKMTALVVDSARTFFVGDSIQLTATYEPANATFTDLIWESSDEKIATVTQEGYVEAIKDGSCVISVSNKDKSVVAKCKVTVLPIKMTSLTISKSKCDVAVGDSVKLSATFTPNNVTYADLYWESSDEEVAIVDANGCVKAMKAGNCVISVTNEDKTMSATCKVKVYVIEMTSLSLNETKREIAFGEYESFELKATYEPSKVTYPMLYWSSSDESVAKVTEGRVEIVGVGTCVISVTNEGKTLTAECEVTVHMQEITAMSCLETKTLECGESFILTATYEPSFVSPGCDALYWESSDESVATVNKETGEVTCVGVGECTITIGNTYNDVTAVCHLTVLPISVKSISLDKTSLQALIGKTYKLSYTINPDNAANKEVKWESSDNSIATVAEDGTVTPISKGKATIKVTAQDGSNSFAECVVEVMDEQDYADLYVEVECSDVRFNSGMMGYCNFKVNIANKGEEKIALARIEVYSTKGNMAYSESYDNRTIAAGAKSAEYVDLGGGLNEPDKVICYFSVAGGESKKTAIVSVK